MQTEHVLDITRQALKTACLLSAPVLVFGLVVGVLTNVFQAVTQISETTLAVVPKILAMMLAFVLFSPWMIDIISDFTTQLFTSIPNVIR
jgi:flagellar biosynthesis protein FliQ